MEEENQGLVIHYGSRLSHCGFSGDDAPRSVFPTEVWKPKNPGIMVGMDDKDCYVTCVGDSVSWRSRSRMKLIKPIRNGEWERFPELEKICHHTFYNELRVAPEEHYVTLSEPALNPKRDREKMTHMMFETFNILGLYMVMRNVLSLYSNGKTIGMSVHSGDSVTNVVPVYEGLPLIHAVQSIRIGGKVITDRLVKLLSERGIEMTHSAEIEIVRDIKEKLCYVSNDYETELKKAVKSDDCKHEYELPDGSKITIGSERFRAPEIMFKPSLIGSKTPSLPEITVNSIKKCDSDLWRDLFPNIVLTGGNSMFEEMEKRLSSEITKLIPKDNNVTNEKIKVHASAERKFSIWIGGSILSSLSMFLNQNMLMRKEEYDEAGETLIHRKCF